MTATGGSFVWLQSVEEDLWLQEKGKKKIEIPLTLHQTIMIELWQKGGADTI